MLAMTAPATKSSAVAQYREEISRYLKSVMAQEGWNHQQAADALGVTRWTVSRALAGTNTIGYLALLGFSERTGNAIPEGLRRAAVAVNEPLTRDAAPEVRDYIADVLQASEEQQRALFNELARKFSAG
jgi:predicted transcriptional regulator